MTQATQADLSDILGQQLTDALARVATGTAEDIATIGASMATNAAEAAALGRQDLLDHIGDQARALAEARRVQIAQEGWALLTGIIQGGVGMLAGLVQRGAAAVVA